MSRTTLTATGPSRTSPSRLALSTADLTMLRRMLEQQRAFRIEQLGELHRPGPPGPLGSADDEVFSSLAAGARAALRDVQAALWRMDEGHYGVCTTCAAALKPDVLEILPQTARCLPCQRAARPGQGADPGR